MMRLSLAAEVVGGKLHGADDEFRGVVIDARETKSADLFVALPGSRRDGHDFIKQAQTRGAVAALVSKYSGAHLAQISVGDTSAGLVKLGGHWRSQFNIPTVAVTGSCGKTSVVNLTAAILKQSGKCLSPHKNFNNHWGVSLTLLRLRAQHNYAVLELGMNQRGEISDLSKLVAADVAVINNVGAAHLAGLGSLQNIAAAKSEILHGLSAGATVVLNKDDEFYDYWKKLCSDHRVIDFGIKQSAKIRATDIELTTAGSAFKFHINGQSAVVNLNLLGQHNIYNALAASAAANAVGAKFGDIVNGLQGFGGALPGRLQKIRLNNDALLLDDTYNANPSSSKSSLDALACFDGERVAVFGAMAELGEAGVSLHREIGKHAKQIGINKFFIFGDAKSDELAAYKQGFQDAVWHDDLNKLIIDLVADAQPNATILIKGSRAAGMERVVAGLMGGDKC